MRCSGGALSLPPLSAPSHPHPKPPPSHHGSHYTAERMSLVLLGGQSLDTLEAWARECFAGLPTGRGPRPTFEDAGATPRARRSLTLVPEPLTL